MIINIEAFNKLAFPALKCVDAFNFEDGFETFNNIINQEANLVELASVSLDSCTSEQISQFKDKLKEHYLKECFEKKVRDYLVEHNQLTPYLNWFFEKVKLGTFASFYDRMPLILEQSYLEYLLSYTIRMNLLDYAKSFSSFVHMKNLERYEVMMETIFDYGLTDALYFVLETFDNIHFNNHKILQHSLKLNDTRVLDKLISIYKFSPNAIDNDKNTLIYHTIKDNKPNLFIHLIKNYGKDINLLNKNEQDKTIFDYLNNNTFFSLIDNILDEELSPNILAIVFKKMFENDFLRNYASHDIYKKLFSQKNFDPKIFNLGKSNLYYYIVDMAFMTSSSELVANQYLVLLENFLKTYKKQINNFYVFNPLTYVIKESQEYKYFANDVVSKLLCEFRDIVNEADLEKYPLDYAKQEEMFSLLIGQGANVKSANNKEGLKKLFKFKNKDSSKEVIKEVAAPVKAEEPKEEANFTVNGTVQEVKAQMSAKYLKMKDLIDEKIFPMQISLRIDNLYLKMKQSLDLVIEHNELYQPEEVFFIDKVIDNYLLKIIQSYYSVSKMSINFEQDSIVKKDTVLGVIVNEEVVDMNSVNNMKEECLKQIELIESQINLINQNIKYAIMQKNEMQLKENNLFLSSKM
jgi:hypothetical protein